MQLTIGKHNRRDCPVLIPVSCDCAVCSVQIGSDRLIGQRLRRDGTTYICCILPEGTAGADYQVSCGDAGSVAPNVVLADDGAGQVAVTIGGQPFTVYHYAGSGKRPYCYPVLGPGGVKMTRDYPMIPDLPGDSTDHPHQRSLWTAFGDVNGVDDWGEVDPRSGYIVHRGFSMLESGPVFGQLVEQLDWVSADGVKLMSEEREVIFYNTPAEHRLLDWSVSLHATFGPVRLGDTKEGGILSVRVNSVMEGSRGGVIENGCGGIGEAECWGKPAPWCDYSGTIDGTHAGIAVFDWRENPGFPTNWHVRDYGLMTANIFGQSAFLNSPLYNGDRVIQQGASLDFNYRIFIHADSAGQAGVGERYLDFAYPPEVSGE
jgi:hypothetical protein